MQTGKRFVNGLSLLLATLCANVFAVPPPAGTVTALDNVGLFDGSQDLLDSCVTLQNPDGSTQLDGSGNPLRFDIVLELDRATLTFRLLSNVPPADPSLDCSGVYRAGIYTDAVLITNLGPYYNGGVWNITMDYVPGSNLEFKLRIDSSFSGVRNFADNSTALGSDLGDFAQSAVREYGLSSLPPAIAMELPECNDPQGDQNFVTLRKSGVPFGSAMPGTSFGWSTSGLTAGDYQFTVFCNDQIGIQNLASTLGVDFSSSYVAHSPDAPGTLTIRITDGSTPTTPTSELSFNFGSSTSASDQELIREAALFARDFFTTTFGRTLQKNATITTLGATGGCASAGASAFTGPQSVTFCTGNRGWTDHGPVMRRKIVMHEVFHLLQFELRWTGGPPGTSPGPHWLIEGAAEYVGWLAAAAQGHLTLDTARGCMLKEVADFALQQPPGLGNLSAYETAQSFGGGPVYPLAMLGVDQLVSGSSVNALLNYGTALAAGTAVTESFSSAFGTTTTAFYAQFPAYKANLTVPPNYLCGI